MKRGLPKPRILLALAASVLLGFACQSTDTDEIAQPGNGLSASDFGDASHNCRFHSSRSAAASAAAASDSYYDRSLRREIDTKWIYSDVDLLDKFWNLDKIAVYIWHGSQSMNAIAYSSNVITFGENLYYDFLGKFGYYSAAGVMAHEWGHQIQYDYNFNGESRDMELEADNFAGYYLGHEGGRELTWKESSGFFDALYSIGDYSYNSPSHHGTPAQRRSAGRLGWLLADWSNKNREVGIQELHKTFFYYYNEVLEGSSFGRSARMPATSEEIAKGLDKEIIGYLNGHYRELKRIHNGEIKGKEYSNL
ncbi:hypothetical protein FUAX_04810 [Fulvitalea axinellae]|uniref:Uncharacterized protein n=1 Tax=Fulvitalea axinellae TaxID=1182444 RepID=A0AAU9CNX2_9BACT|nr:hypothetical protein FUAX_04810 [Fulvitalea axinellae]